MTNHIIFETLPKNLSKQDIYDAMREIWYYDMTASFIF